VKAAYRSIAPPALRRSRFVDAAKNLLYRHLPHDLVYSREYFESVIEGVAAASASTIAESVLRDISPRTVIDVGCGTGALLQALRAGGCRVTGLEYASAAIAMCRARGIDVQPFNLEEDDFEPGRTFDLAMSLEVAEHLPESVADRYVGILSRAAPVVVMTAAPPGQRGTDHVNEQPPEYWIQKFRHRGLAPDEPLSARWADEWRRHDSVAPYYWRNLLVFRRVSSQR
jgi:SAM-dependent methyltransferase